jgi:tetratricopeptide (TPR) repeat protein
MTKDSLAEAVINKIAKAKFDEAFAFLKPYIRKGSATQRHLLVLEANYNIARQTFAENRLDYEGFTRELAKVSQPFIDTCQNLSEEDIALEIPPHAYDMDKPLEPKVQKLAAKKDSHKISLEAKRLRKAGQYAEALQLWEELPLDKQNRIAFLNELAMLHRLMGNYEKALFVLDGIKNDTRRDEKCLNELATCYRELNRLQSAIETLELGLTWSPRNNHFHTNLFFIHLFFTLDTEGAKQVRDNYYAETGEHLIQNESMRAVYDEFLTHLKDIKGAMVQNNLLERYLKECLQKRAFTTARYLIDRIKKQGKIDTWIIEIQNMLPAKK